MAKKFVVKANYIYITKRKEVDTMKKLYIRNTQTPQQTLDIVCKINEIIDKVDSMTTEGKEIKEEKKDTWNLADNDKAREILLKVGVDRDDIKEGVKKGLYDMVFNQKDIKTFIQKVKEDIENAEIGGMGTISSKNKFKEIIDNRAGNLK